MKTPLSCLLRAAACAWLVSACGPDMDAEESPFIDPLAQPSNAGDLGRKLGAPVAIFSNTCAASNLWQTSCGSGISRDISYTWTVPAAGTYSFSTDGSSFETVLEIRDYRNTAKVMGCTAGAATQRTSGMNLELNSGQVLLITIEGAGAECGKALLNIHHE